MIFLKYTYILINKRMKPNVGVFVHFALRVTKLQLRIQLNTVQVFINCYNYRYRFRINVGGG